MRPTGKVLVATAAFAALHSLLASRPVKAAVEKRFGVRTRNAFYRPFFNAQAVLTSGALVAYIWKLPTRTLYEVKGVPAVIMQLGRLAALFAMGAAVRQVGLARMAGGTSLAAYRRGEAQVPREPEAQGPAPGEDGRLRTGGPFAFSRHPLNFLALPILWLSPRMTSRLLAFNCLATVYFWLGSWHEEVRLRAAYGRAYVDYRRRTAFFLSLRRRPASLPGPVSTPTRRGATTSLVPVR